MHAHTSTAASFGDASVCLQDRVSFDDFELLKVLGKGSFGKVMLVRQKGTRKVFAMKSLQKSMWAPPTPSPFVLVTHISF